METKLQFNHLKIKIQGGTVYTLWPFLGGRGGMTCERRIGTNEKEIVGFHVFNSRSLQIAVENEWNGI